MDFIRESSDVSGISVDDPVPTIILIIDLMITEILCFIFVVDYSFFQIFLKMIDDFPKVPLLANLETVQCKDINLYALESDIVLDYPISSNPNKLGILYKGEYKLRNAAIRRLELIKVNNYIKEKLYEEMGSLNLIICPHFLAPLALSIRNDYIDIVYPFIQTGSLNSAILSNYSKFSYILKIKIAREVAFCIKTFHDANKVHGHLTSHNILLNSQNDALVTDLGLNHLKKYCGIATGYINKSSWTSPQLLNESSEFVTKSNKSDDAYSFGVVL